MLTTEILNESKRLLERPLDEDSGHQSDCSIKSQFFPKGAVYFSQVDLTFLSLSFLTWEMEPFTVRPTLEGVSYQVQQLSGRTSGYLHCERGKGVSPEQGLWHVTDDFFFSLSLQTWWAERMQKSCPPPWLHAGITGQACSSANAWGSLLGFRCCWSAKWPKPLVFVTAPRVIVKCSGDWEQQAWPVTGSQDSPGPP